MLEFKPGKERRGWKRGYKGINKTTVYGFKSRRKWLLKNFQEGGKIGHGRLRGQIDYDLLNYKRSWIDRQETRRFLNDNIGKTYQEAWEKYLSLLRPVRNKYCMTVKLLEADFKEALGILVDSFWISNGSEFMLDWEGKITKRKRDLNYKPRKIYPEYVLVYNGTGEVKVMDDMNIGKLDLGKYYAYDPSTEKLIKNPVSVFFINYNRWGKEWIGKDSFLLRNYSLVIVPGWKIKGGYFIARKKEIAKNI